MVNQLFFRSLGDLRKLDVAELLPFDNPRVVCMVSIASATFTAVDTVDAAIRAVLVGLQDEPKEGVKEFCLLYTSPSPRDAHESRMPSSA